MTFLHRLEVLITVLVVWAACAPPNQVEFAIPLPTASATPSACQPSPITLSASSPPEIQGTMKSEGELWALLFFEQAVVQKDAKIVWRITGTEEQVNVQAQHEDGTIIQPVWGPQYHESSTWERPGEEWGTGFNFPTPGCWTLTVTRGTTRGEIRLQVWGTNE